MDRLFAVRPHGLALWVSYDHYAGTFFLTATRADRDHTGESDRRLVAQASEMTFEELETAIGTLLEACFLEAF